MNGLVPLLKRTWVDWAVFVYVVVTAARCKSPFLVVFFTLVALVAAVVAVLKTRRLMRGADPVLSRTAHEARPHHRS